MFDGSQEAVLKDKTSLNIPAASRYSNLMHSIYSYYNQVNATRVQNRIGSRCLSGRS
ncbi:hypothetical protein EJF18_10707 [Clavispora lusitaniae]|uniref:Uncharacterized protein n=1 Tax=Clavispora lusitaniae TaxID=36911 RepID=A0ACD0WEE9_CLALS|nr:hypothetical protein EJF14_10707 [Clavispora lusitaniae]QFZ31091.1 hypothetical protein EJF16_10707 [Clavispora lusitaniae]QFZ36759.1 hypothetical protein EJF15_10707 [Clavispora lusitaniae]QFZ42443.1 hypothetical protein EJF18_10707 [Clavispora lusitaniae]QFZ48119.1 hypothetical protein EJF17_10707 [Clavispora lusitaniae]